MTVPKWYGAGLLRVFSAGIDFSSDTFKCSLHGSGYTPDFDVDEFFDEASDEVSGTGYTAGGVALTGVSLYYDASTGAVRVACDNPTWAAATITGIRYAVIRKDTGSPSTSPLVGCLDFETDQAVSAAAGTVVIPFGGLLAVTIA